LSLHRFEHKVCSQNGEDGILQHIFQAVGEGSKRCLEFGFGRECNTLNLVANCGWRGTFADARSDVCMVMGYLEGEKVHIINASLTVENVNEVFKDVPREIDLISIDVDGVDYWLWKELEIKARVAVVEYNASFGDVLSVTVPYRADFDRMKIHPLYHGASLAALTKMGANKGMKLVGCESTGINAFFVRSDLPIVEVSVRDAYVPHRGRMPFAEALRFIEMLKLPLQEVS
jgi:hypothetical protein